MSNARNIANLPNGDDAPVYACRAYVKFSGTSGTTADNKTINKAKGVSSVYESSTGVYTINLSPTMPDTDYIALVSSSYNSTTLESVRQFKTGSFSASSFELRVGFSYTSPGYHDHPEIFVAVIN